MSEARVGWRVTGRGDRPIGRVEAVFVDYLLVRTGGLLPVDQISLSDERVVVDASAAEAYRRWHRPLRRVAHD